MDALMSPDCDAVMSGWGDDCVFDGCVPVADDDGLSELCFDDGFDYLFDADALSKAVAADVLDAPLPPVAHVVPVCSPSDSGPLSGICGTAAGGPLSPTLHGMPFLPAYASGPKSEASGYGEAAPGPVASLAPSNADGASVLTTDVYTHVQSPADPSGPGDPGVVRLSCAAPIVDAQHPRAESLKRYREKKARRALTKGMIRYKLRKINADARPRIKGRFVKKSESTTDFAMVVRPDFGQNKCQAGSPFDVGAQP
mmetsp:Transcript_34048/g.101278  ORF Transcript_34048/g.101278 Transcript_34048/m.101278 type:complete len:255 (-) Transcript_34048:1286-2050(-)